jgi:hypothetical protein
MLTTLPTAQCTPNDERKVTGDVFQVLTVSHLR